MNETRRCPDCGAENPAEAERCAQCGFPLAEPAAAPPPATGSPLPPPRRTPRPRPASNQALSLWLVFGTLCAFLLIYIAVKANVDRERQVVEGSSQSQQGRADSLAQAVERDSTNVEARVRLGDVFYDTGNWSEAIVHYRSAVAHDSSQTAALVDLGVCYYNLGDQAEAERHFQLALKRDPHHPVALFNLGIVNERRGNHRAALQYLHRALESGPPESVREALLKAMTRVQEKAGVTPQPLPDGR